MGVGLGVTGGQTLVDVTKVKKRRLRERKRAVVAKALEPISTLLGTMNERKLSVVER